MVGAVVGPFALRLRGNYLVIVTLGLVFLGEHLWKNWDSVTGGGNGTSVRAASTNIGPLDFKDLHIVGAGYEKEQGMFWLVWAIVAIVALLAKNLVRSRAGRAMQAVRDRDLSAEVIGVNLARYKVGAFAWSSAFAALSGALYGIVTNRLETNIFNLVPLDHLRRHAHHRRGRHDLRRPSWARCSCPAGSSSSPGTTATVLFDPLIIASPGDSGFLSIGEFNNILFGLFIVVFLHVRAARPCRPLAPRQDLAAHVAVLLLTTDNQPTPGGKQHEATHVVPTTCPGPGARADGRSLWR